VYYACAVGRAVGRSCRYVAEARNRDPDAGWGELARRLGVEPGSEAFERLEQGFAPPYERWARPLPPHYNDRMPAAAHIVAFDPRWREDFARLNLEWLRRWFVVEPVDAEVLGDPERHILADGGQVLFALDAGGTRAIGTVALR